MRYLLAAAVLAGCSHAATVTPVAIVSWPMPAREQCDLPDLPNDVVVVGWPDGERIYVTKTDLTGLLYHQGAMHLWAEAVSRCVARWNGRP